MYRVRFAASFAAAVLVSSVAMGAAEVGKPAPDFALPDDSGKPHKLADYRGKVVVLEWTNPECPFVKRHYNARTMQSLVDQFKGKNVVWLAIDSSNFVTPENVREWRAQNKLTYATLLDPKGEVGRSYGATSTPQMFVLDEKGAVQYMGAIDDDPYGDKATRNYVGEAVIAILSGKKPAVQATKPYGCSVKYKS